MNHRKWAATALIMLLTGTLVCAQNIGIGVSNPQERLDVNGNIQLNGTLKINGQPGTAGQVLTSTGTGLAWGNLETALPYMRWQVLANPANGFRWTVPSGITEVMVELWGGGGGGSSPTAQMGNASVPGNAGGGSGAYASAVINVNNVAELIVDVGSGGSGSTGSSASDGQASEIRWSRLGVNYQIEASGGLGSKNGNSGQGGPVNPAANIVPSNISLMQIPGRPGHPATLFHTISLIDGKYYRRIVGAPGGTAYMFENYAIGGNHDGFDPQLTTLNFIFESANNGKLVTPGQGGSTGMRSTSSMSTANGAPGMVIIRW